MVIVKKKKVLAPLCQWKKKGAIGCPAGYVDWLVVGGLTHMQQQVRVIYAAVVKLRLEFLSSVVFAGLSSHTYVYLNVCVC